MKRRFYLRLFRNRFLLLAHLILLCTSIAHAEKWIRVNQMGYLPTIKISEFYIFQIINRITPNKEEKGYDLETSEFLFLSLFCNASKTTYLTLQR